MEVQQKDNILTMTRTYKAPKALVFSMFQNPHIKEWWGPETWPVGTSDQDFRTGGNWHYSMVGPDGTEAWGKAVYDEIDEPNKIVLRDYFSDAEGTIDETLPAGVITMTFEEVDGGTLYTMHGEYESAEAVQKLVEMGMVAGMQDTSNQLAKLLEDMQ